MRKIIISVIVIAALAGCSNEKSPSQTVKSNYFDVNAYFNGEAKRLNQLRPEITKAVSINDSSETRHIKIEDWNKELAVFSAGDIRKVSWEGLFTVVEHGDTTIYRSNNDKVSVKMLQIIKNDAKVLEVSMEIVRKNILFVSTDLLSYYPDSLYDVKRQQNIKLLPQKKYQVTGRFKSKFISN